MPFDEKALPEGVLVAWVGDDFTGAAAVMEVLTFAGLPTVLFLESPTAEQLAKFPDVKGVGIATTARAQSPEWMEEKLPPLFDKLMALEPQLLHYKVCSTLDSSSTVGSIGKAIEIGTDLLQVQIAPIVTAAPKMKRYQVFGHLFADSADGVVRLDKHPVMSRHPVTPMTESDVALHVSHQSERLRTCLLPYDSQLVGDYEIPISEHVPNDETLIVSIDVLDDKTERAAGRALWNTRDRCPFVVGSQGVEYSLVEHWQSAKLIEMVSPQMTLKKSGILVSISGSVSPTTAEQIRWSAANGFSCIRFNPSSSIDDERIRQLEIDRVVRLGLDAISQGFDPLIYSAKGPDDYAVVDFRASAQARNIEIGVANKLVAEALGQVLFELLSKSGARRAVVSGGDTSGFATKLLGIYALSAVAPTIAGASICRAHADNEFDGLELALKGGQMGSHDYFGWVREGGGTRNANQNQHLEA